MPIRHISRVDAPPPGHQGPRRTMADRVWCGDLTKATHWRHPAGYTRPIPAPVATAREAA